MKKQLHFIVSLFLVLVMVASMGFTAFAEDGFEIHGAKKAEGWETETVKVSVTTNGDGLYAGNKAYIAVKQSTGMMIWTQTKLTGEQQSELAAVIKAADKSNYTIMKFISGEGTFTMGDESQYQGEYTFNVSDDGDVVTLTCLNDRISHAVYGTYTIPEEEPTPEYEWVKVGEGGDTATGYGKTNLKAFSKGNNWFIGQMVKLADGETETLDVQAGNPKNGTNFIGTISLKRNGDDVKISYKVNDDLFTALPDIDGYELGDQVTITELKNASYKVAKEYTTVGSNGSKYMTSFGNGSTFEAPADEFYIYVHFEAVYTTYEVVEAE